jgi:hypothetical protein
MGNKTNNNPNKAWINAAKSATQMKDLKDDELQESFLYVTSLEYKVFQQVNQLHDKINHFNEQKRRLQREADRRNRVLMYPDEVNAGMQHYFEAERKTKGLVSQPTPKAVISADSDPK